MSEELVVVIAGGGPLSPRAVDAVPPGAVVIAADAGLEQAQALGLDVALAVGDFDSATPASVARAKEAGTRIERHPAEKDATDLELALDAAVGLSPSHILVLAPRGGRLDHELAGFLVLASDRYASSRVDALVGDAGVHVVRGARVLDGTPGTLVSLLPVNGPATGVATEGLLYPLRGETLGPGSTRGISNVFAAETARVEVAGGVVVAIVPGELE